MHKIAVLDDDENWCFAIQRYFKREFAVTSFRGISSFLRDIQQFDLVIVDFSLPNSRHDIDMNGCQIIQHVRKTVENPPVLILATGFISRNDMELCQSFCPEADAFLAKDAGLDIALKQTQKLLAHRSPSSNSAENA